VEKPATAIEIVILTVCYYLSTISVAASRDKQTTSETHIFPRKGPNSVKLLWKKE